MNPEGHNVHLAHPQFPSVYPSPMTGEPHVAPLVAGLALHVFRPHVADVVDMAT